MCSFFILLLEDNCFTPWISGMCTYTPSLASLPQAELPVLDSSFPLATYLTHGTGYMSTPLFQFLPPSPSPLCPQVHPYVSVSLPARKQIHLYHSSRFCMNEIIYSVCFFSFWLIVKTLGPSTSLQMTNFPFLQPSNIPRSNYVSYTQISTWTCQQPYMAYGYGTGQRGSRTMCEADCKDALPLT